MTVLHASAVLAWLQQEPGCHLIDFTDANITTTDFAVVLEEARLIGLDPDAVYQALVGMVHVMPTHALDVLEAAKLDPRLPMADRLAMALADKLKTTLVTSDSLWA